MAPGTSRGKNTQLPTWPGTGSAWGDSHALQSLTYPLSFAIGSVQVHKYGNTLWSTIA